MVVYGIVTLIEGEAGAQVHALWAELRERLGPAATAEMTHPHTTYHCADGYEPAALEELLSRAAARMAPFTIRAPGVGFVGTPEGGVAWVNLSRTPRLDELHRSL